jgi:predicted TPR repeat methyltransferase
MTEQERSHLDGELLAAEAFYREIVSVCPSEAKARHYLGFLLQQTDRLSDACEQLTCAIALDGRHAEWHFNLGIVRSRQGQVAAAIDAFSAAIAINPDPYFYWTNLGACFEQSLGVDRAEQCYLTAVKIDPGCPDAYYLLSALCLKLARFNDARHFNDCGIIAAPEEGQSIIVRGQAYHGLGRAEEAIALFERWQQAEDNPVAAHLLAAYRGLLAPDQCSRQYVEQTFDASAHSFDHILGRLKYCCPELVGDYLDALELSPVSLDVLDLGCGTGLVGERLKQVARILTGVDLSAAMLDQAAAKQLYQHLYKFDIADFLSSSEGVFDLVTCMDTFIYIGRLEEVLALIYLRLKKGGRFIFSTEKLLSAHGRGFQLNISGRYSHHQDYLTKLLGDIGFQIEDRRDVHIRTESGCPIEGEFFCAVRGE